MFQSETDFPQGWQAGQEKVRFVANTCVSEDNKESLSSFLFLLLFLVALLFVFALHLHSLAEPPWH